MTSACRVKARDGCGISRAVVGNRANPGAFRVVEVPWRTCTTVRCGAVLHAAGTAARIGPLIAADTRATRLRVPRHTCSVPATIGAVCTTSVAKRIIFKPHRTCRTVVRGVVVWAAQLASGVCPLSAACAVAPKLVVPRHTRRVVGAVINGALAVAKRIGFKPIGAG